MKEVAISENANQAETRAAKRTYQGPALHVYGKLHLLTQGSGSANGDGGQGMMTPNGSDRSIKENIVSIGTHPLGIALYLFDYKPEYRDAWGHGRQFGVMADEVAMVIPEAVSMHRDGYKMVNYAMLGMSRTLH